VGEPQSSIRRKPMKILFVYDNMYLWGGVQTLLIRLSRALRTSGHEVELLSRPSGEAHDTTPALIDEIGKNAKVHLADGDWLEAPRSLRALALPAADVIVACNLGGLLLTSMMHRHLMPTAKVVVGVYSPREYCWRSSTLRRRWIQHLGKRSIRQLPLENLMFCTDEMARVTGECAGRDFGSSPVLPLAIDTDRLRPSPDRAIDRRKIVAVSRLAHQYTHHRQMIGVIRDLRDRGHHFTYHAYGDGEDRAALEAEVRDLAVDDAVFFHGSVPYDRFGEVIGDALAFIGHGTSLLEAAACGIPALVGIESSRAPLTYGFLHETTGNDLGGYVPGHPEHPIADRILWLADRTDDEYRHVGSASRARAEEFGLARLMPRFIDIIDGARPHSFDVSRADRALERGDRVLAALLWKLGVDTSAGGRHVRA
jgi:glycosyltransferase involved in cell wall biosynthesis